jgi:hypothetical protein
VLISSVTPAGMSVVLNEDSHLPTNESIKVLDKYAVSKIIIHPKYNESTRRHDIALVRLEDEIDFFEKLLNPVCVPAKNEVYYQRFNGTVTRWSDPTEPGPLDEKVKVPHPIIQSQSKLIIPLISNQQCNTETAHKGMISDEML